jgi:hypothetical protein
VYDFVGDFAAVKPLDDEGWFFIDQKGEAQDGTYSHVNSGKTSQIAYNDEEGTVSLLDAGLVERASIAGGGIWELYGYCFLHDAASKTLKVYDGAFNQVTGYEDVDSIDIWPGLVTINDKLFYELGGSGRSGPLLGGYSRYSLYDVNGGVIVGTSQIEDNAPKDTGAQDLSGNKLPDVYGKLALADLDPGLGYYSIVWGEYTGFVDKDMNWTYREPRFPFFDD